VKILLRRLRKKELLRNPKLVLLKVFQFRKRFKI